METKQACQKCNQEFILDQNELGFYEKMKVPAPKVCPDCRFKMRAMFRNETTLYSGRKCGLCGKGVISMYNPKPPYTIYCHDCFYSEKWDPKDYAMDYNESRSFLEQVKELFIKVPKITTYLSSSIGPNINSEYVNMAGGCRNCYLVFNTMSSEDTMYSRGVRNSRDSADMYFGQDFERCYESINVEQSSGILFGQNISSSIDSAFVLNCKGSINCFGCVNLNNKSYHFLNQHMNKEEYKKKVGEILGSYQKIQEFKKEFESFALQFPVRENNNLKTIDSTGDYLFECKNVSNSFEVIKGEDCKYIYSSKMIKDSMGVIGHGLKSEKMLEVVATGLSSNIVGTYGAENCSDILYGFCIRNCKNCIGCDALHHGEYSILNKQYPKEEYERLREIIIKELTEKDLYGLMMPEVIALFAYNETIAQDNFPITKDEALAQGFRWEDDIQKTEGNGTINSENIPDHIKDVEDSIIKEVLACVFCNRNYKITDQELSFYKKMNIPIPRKCFYCRHQDRIEKRGPFKFWQRNCAKCYKAITTNYSPDRPEIVYCEKCYQQEVY